MGMIDVQAQSGMSIFTGLHGHRILGKLPLQKFLYFFCSHKVIFRAIKTRDKAPKMKWLAETLKFNPQYHIIIHVIIL